MFAGIAHQLHPAVQPQFFGYVRPMTFRRANADVQFFADLAIGIALHDQFEHFDFARRQRFSGLRRQWPAASWLLQSRRTMDGSTYKSPRKMRLDGRDQLSLGRMFQNIPGRASLDRLAQQGLIFVNGQNQDMHAGELRLDLAG